MCVVSCELTSFLFPRQTSRGTTADICLIDEAAHVPQELFTEVVFPILKVAKTSMICLSSPDGAQNHFARWSNLRDRKSGKRLFHVLHTVNICKRCRKLPDEKAIQCQHTPRTEHWLNARREERIKRFYDADPALGMQEFAGAIVDTQIRAFQQEDVVALFKVPRAPEVVVPDIIFTTADNSGAGASHLAFTSAYFRPQDGNLMVSRHCVHPSPGNDGSRFRSAHGPTG